MSSPSQSIEIATYETHHLALHANLGCSSVAPVYGTTLEPCFRFDPFGIKDRFGQEESEWLEDEEGELGWVDTLLEDENIEEEDGGEKGKNDGIDDPTTKFEEQLEDLRAECFYPLSPLLSFENSPPPSTPSFNKNVALPASTTFRTDVFLPTSTAQPLQDSLNSPISPCITAKDLLNSFYDTEVAHGNALRLVDAGESIAPAVMNRWHRSLIPAPVAQRIWNPTRNMGRLVLEEVSE
jgi:hypothetical protein